MRDIIIALEQIAAQIAQTRQVVHVEMFADQAKLRELNQIALQLIAAQHAAANALAIARRI